MALMRADSIGENGGGQHNHGDAGHAASSAVTTVTVIGERRFNTDVTVSADYMLIFNKQAN